MGGMVNWHAILYSNHGYLSPPAKMRRSPQNYPIAQKKLDIDNSSFMIQKRTFTYKGKYMVITFAKFVYESPTKLSEKWLNFEYVGIWFKVTFREDSIIS